MSVAFLLLRLLGPSSFWRKWFLYVNLVLNFVFGSLTVIFTFAQCNPPRALWEGTTKLPHAKCWNPASQLDFSIFSSSRFEAKNCCKTPDWLNVGYNALLDLCLALLPLTVVWNLNLKMETRIALSTCLSLGILYGDTDLFVCLKPCWQICSASACAAIKTSKLPELTARADLTCKSWRPTLNLRSN